MNVQRFRKKPVVIEAFQWFPEMGECGGIKMVPPVEISGRSQGLSLPPYYVIDTLEGQLTVSPGDWIITGVNGERYPCKPDIFEKTYDYVEEKETHPQRCCAVCSHGNPCAENRYQCRLNPPVTVISESREGTFSWWPEVGPSDFCGKFENVNEALM